MELPANMNANNSEQILSNHTQDIIESEINFTKEQTKIELVSRKTEIMAVDDKNVLIEENERLKGERLCVVCLNKDKNVLFLPCVHLAACLDCCFNLNNCAICRSKIQAFVRTFS
jgi:baculoviral IAP repeat-containing protein 7/8